MNKIIRDAAKPYLDHRKRMRRKFAADGFHGFHDYEVLEFLLFYIFRQGDTKPKAKRLIDKFGSFSKVLDAKAEDLAKVKGMGKESALALKAFRSVLSYYFSEELYDNPGQINSLTSLIDYAKSQIGDKHNEVMLVVYLNAKGEVIHSDIISEGTINQLTAYPRKMVEDALRHNASSLIMVHNHPGGNPEPSSADIELTDLIGNALSVVDIDISEHLILAGSEYFSFASKGML